MKNPGQVGSQVRVSRKTQVGSRSYGFFLSRVVVMEEGQERDCSPDEEGHIIDDDDMEDSPTDSPDFWTHRRIPI